MFLYCYIFIIYLYLNMSAKLYFLIASSHVIICSCITLVITFIKLENDLAQNDEIKRAAERRNVGHLQPIAVDATLNE